MKKKRTFFLSSIPGIYQWVDMEIFLYDWMLHFSHLFNLKVSLDIIKREKRSCYQNNIHIKLNDVYVIIVLFI